MAPLMVWHLFRRLNASAANRSYLAESRMGHASILSPRKTHAESAAAQRSGWPLLPAMNVLRVAPVAPVAPQKLASR